MKRVVAVVLAAGLSSRMKQNKLLMKLGDKSIIRLVLECIGKSKVDEIIVVVGHEKEKIRRETSGCGVTILDNLDYQQGMSTSLKTAVECLEKRKDVGALLIFTGDMPFIREETINRVIAGYNKTDARIVVPRYKGRRGHPVLIDSKLFFELLTVKGDTGARGVLQNHWDEIEWIEVDDYGIHLDIDNQETYERVQENYTEGQ